MITREPTIEIHGPVARHDQRCAVLRGAAAVLDMDQWVFQPSWRAQADGWALVQARTRFQRLALRFAFGIKQQGAAALAAQPGGAE